MKERVVTAVRIQHHRIKAMPHLMRLPVSDDGDAMSLKQPIEAPRGLIVALALSGLLWAAIAAVSF